MSELTFEPFPKIPRLRRSCTITEKIDGTNAQVIITEDGQIGAASRKRLITPEVDNYGFARWVADNSDDLLALGPGRHFGEWWGQGVQRGYEQDRKRFSLFNTKRWNEDNPPPGCCDIVPTLYVGEFTTDAVDEALDRLRAFGSAAAPGFMRPEGIIVWHSTIQAYSKVLLEGDELPKSMAGAS